MSDVHREKERRMKRQLSVSAAMAMLLSCATSTMAQMTVDVAKITCKQYILYEVVDGRTLAVWLSGYYSAQRGTTLVDIPDLQAKADVVREYCFRHYDEPLMDAVKKALGTTK
jgi:hypothetical protein